jgi:hypothetical protein
MTTTPDFTWCFNKQPMDLAKGFMVTMIRAVSLKRTEAQGNNG